MPFISKDWRSPGEEWVKTDEGWEKRKVLECRLTSSSAADRSDDPSDPEQCQAVSRSWMREKSNETVQNTSKYQFSDRSGLQPHCHITIKCTREIAGFNGLSDALKRLDFRGAVHDTRKFKYICKLLDLLVNDKLTTLSGCAQKVLFNMLEDVAYHVSTSQQNPQLLRKFLLQLRTLVDCTCWGRPIGSTQLWQNHLATINRIMTIANHLQIHQPEAVPKLMDLPEECVREVLLRLADHKDLEAASGAWDAMARLCDEQRIWRELCHFHFTPQQIHKAIGQEFIDWRTLYHKLRKMHGLREEYAEMIQLCRNCRCLFWASYGHPCIADDPSFSQKLDDVDKSSLHVPIPPHAFLKFFSL